MFESRIDDITHVIQLAVAPVFLLTAIATLIGGLNMRLGRIIDRRRLLQEHLRQDVEDAGKIKRELALLTRRMRLSYFAILTAVVAALMVCLVVASAFLGALITVDLARAVAVFFILALLTLTGSLALYLREIFLAVTDGTHKIH
jgi:hypothetical protein